MVCEARVGQLGERIADPFSSLFIGMVCEALRVTRGGVVRLKLSVPSSSGWCVKPVTPEWNDAVHLAFSSLFIGMVCEALKIKLHHDVRRAFQFPLHRDGV